MRKMITTSLASSVALLNCGASCMLHSPCNLPVVFPGGYVQVLNDQTGEGIADAVVRVITADGAYSEPLSGDADGDYVGGYGLTGALTVTAEAPGFVSQQLDDVVGQSGPDCRSVPANLVVRLTPAT